MGKRTIALSAIVWAVVWATGGWLFGNIGLEKGGRSWLIGMPFVLPTSMAIWGTIEGAVLSRRVGPILGAVLGTVWGASFGIAGFMIFAAIGSQADGLAFRNVPAWWTVEVIFMVAGLVAGGLAGTLAGICTVIAKKEPVSPPGH